MKNLVKIILSASLFCMPAVLFAVENQDTVKPMYVGLPIQAQVIKMQDGGALIYLPEANGLVVGQFEAGITEILYEKAKNTVCNFPVKPSTVTVSTGVVSATWNVDKLCGGESQQ